MKVLFRFSIGLALIVSLTVSVYSQTMAPEPPNLGVLQKTIRHYISSGAYDNALALKYEEIKQYIITRLDEHKKCAVVMDIDETTLSNLEFELRYGFGYNGEIWHKWVMEANAKAIPASYEFYHWARSKGIDIFFVTGRRAITDNVEDDPTAINLINEGFSGYKKLYLKPKTGKIITFEYKSGARKEIVDMGYIILANIGDQYSDLEGGFAEKHFKLPNPMYFVD